MGDTPLFPGWYADSSWAVRHSFTDRTVSFPEGTLVLHERYALSSPTVRRQEGGRHGALSWAVRCFCARRGPKGSALSWAVRCSRGLGIASATGDFHERYAVSGECGATRDDDGPGFMGGMPSSGPPEDRPFVEGYAVSTTPVLRMETQNATTLMVGTLFRGPRCPFFAEERP